MGDVRLGKLSIQHDCGYGFLGPYLASLELQLAAKTSPMDSHAWQVFPSRLTSFFHIVCPFPLAFRFCSCPFSVQSPTIHTCANV